MITRDLPQLGIPTSVVLGITYKPDYFKSLGTLVPGKFISLCLFCCVFALMRLHVVKSLGQMLALLGI